MLFRSGLFSGWPRPVKASPTGATLYGGACVYALMAGNCRNPAQARAAGYQGLALLSAACEQGYGRDLAASDTDLDSIRARPEFARCLRGEGIAQAP